MFLCVLLSHTSSLYVFLVPNPMLREQLVCLCFRRLPLLSSAQAGLSPNFVFPQRPPTRHISLALPPTYPPIAFVSASLVSIFRAHWASLHLLLLAHTTRTTDCQHRTRCAFTSTSSLLGLSSQPSLALPGQPGPFLSLYFPFLFFSHLRTSCSLRATRGSPVGRFSPLPSSGSSQWVSRTISTASISSPVRQSLSLPDLAGNMDEDLC